MTFYFEKFKLIPNDDGYVNKWLQMMIHFFLRVTLTAMYAKLSSRKCEIEGTILL
jgi:hypothetical protein